MDIKTQIPSLTPNGLCAACKLVFTPHPHLSILKCAKNEFKTQDLYECVTFSTKCACNYILIP